jgi:biotin carboxyl carrier protein
MNSSNKYTVSVAGRSYAVELRARIGNVLTFSVEGAEFSVDIAPHSAKTSTTERTSTSTQTVRESTAQEVKAPMPGIVSDLKVSKGDSVRVGDTLLIIEAMKMENPIKSPRSGTIDRVDVSKGQEVRAGAVLITFL